MNTLEEYLKKEGILERFLGNVNITSSTVETLTSAFNWMDTPEGSYFWAKHCINNSGQIYVSRIKELIIERIPRFRKDMK